MRLCGARRRQSRPASIKAGARAMRIDNPDGQEGPVLLSDGALSNLHALRGRCTPPVRGKVTGGRC